VVPSHPDLVCVPHAVQSVSAIWQPAVLPQSESARVEHSAMELPLFPHATANKRTNKRMS
jgi:hypothetical protein